MRTFLVALALLVVAVGCKVETTVTVDMRDDGSGSVTVDATMNMAAVQAVEAGGGKLEERVRLADLTAAGWTVSPWQRGEDGSARVRATKSFAEPDEVAVILDEVSGAVGPLKEVQATRDRGLASTRYELTGAIDLAALQTGITADPELLANLTGQQVDVNALDASLVEQLKNAVSVRVVANLPGGTTTFVGEAGKSVPIDVSETVVDTRRIGLFAVAAILLAVALVVLLGGVRRRRRRVGR
ncbi:MAG TPA: hypothetical protein VMN58_13905, partial [Acidimicrobiales bacterium]|nr:hypothetical protein [Acidimicrobiales bacterium]